MSRPVRLQLSRMKGFNLQEHSKAVNGMEAINVARPTIYSNPFSTGKPSGYMFEDGGDATPMIAALTREQCIALYRDLVTGFVIPEMHPWGHRWRDHLHKKIGGFYPYGWIKARLAGKNLACWCKPDEPCHADVLLELANGFKCEATP